MASNGYLVDTQVALWILLDEEKQANLRPLKELLSNTDRPVYFSQVSTWEIQIKYSLGKLPLPSPPGKFLIEEVLKSGFLYKQIQDSAIFMLDKLSGVHPIHKDPFDRLLVAHAITEHLCIITSDKSFEKYPVEVFEVSS